MPISVSKAFRCNIVQSNGLGLVHATEEVISFVAVFIQGMWIFPHVFYVLFLGSPITTPNIRMFNRSPALLTPYLPHSILLKL